MNHIDTADFYVHGTRSANELITAAPRPYPADLINATKAGPLRDRSTGEFTTRPEQLRGQVEQNLRELGVDHLDLVNPRVGWTFDRGEGSLANHFGALAELQQAGLIATSAFPMSPLSPPTTSRKRGPPHHATGRRRVAQVCGE